MVRQDGGCAEWKSGGTVELEELPRPVFLRAYKIASFTKIEMHSHPWCQFFFSRRGTVQVQVDRLSLIVPSQYGVWIPAGTEHAVWALDEVECQSLYIKKDFAPAGESHARVVLVSSLVRDFINHLSSSLPIHYDVNGGDGIKVSALLVLMQELADAPMNLPLPKSETLKNMCLQIQAAPGDIHSLESWAQRLSMSPRTLSRHFQQETGMPFKIWRHRLRLMHSIPMLQRGESITNIALDLGYSSTAAYSFAFRILFGVPPTHFARLPN
jgi:AraC-like DNA-binding protein